MKRSIAVCTLLLVSGSAVASAEKVLNVPLYPQQTKDWCWAASAEMVMDYIGNANPEQCHEANLRLGRTDCCQKPTPTECVQGNSPDFDYWGFTNQSDDQLSFAQIKNEIDADRPFVFRWAWVGGGAHLMVINGYKYVAGDPWVHVNNPWPPNKGAKEWISYEEYLSNPKAVNAGNTYDIKNAPHCHSQFQDLDADDFQRCFDEWTARGKWPTTLAADGDTMAGVFAPGKDRPVRSLLSESDYQTRFDAYTSQGFRPATINVDPSSDLLGSISDLFTVIWTPAEGAFVTKSNITEATLRSEWATLAAQGYYTADLYGYDTNAGRRFVATWVQSAHALHPIDLDLTEDEYKARLTAQTAAGYRTRRFSAYQLSGSTHYAVLWEANDTTFYHYFNLSSDGFQAKHDALSQSYDLAYVSMYRGTYSGVWIKK